MLVTHQIEPLGLLCTNLGTKTFFGKFEPKKGSGGGVTQVKNLAFSPTLLASRRVCKI